MNFRSGTPYGYLGQQVTAVDPQISSGHSGYFSAPQEALDPHLFDGEKIKPSVRTWILDTFYAYMQKKYSKPRNWSTVWLAGSGISYQWAGDRGNGDLDVLIGVNWVPFRTANPQYQGLSEDELVQLIDDDLKNNLWPTTANQNINGQSYEVTFYINASATDIRTINPYAAYNLTSNTWTVKPPKLPDDPSSLYPKEYWRAFGAEKRQAEQLVERYRNQRQLAQQAPYGSGRWENAMTGIKLVTDQAKALFDSIHLGRRQAFGPGGSGYGDYYNFRWQAHKRAGTVQALHEISSAASTAEEARQTDIYGNPVKNARATLTEALLWRSNG